MSSSDSRERSTPKRPPGRRGRSGTAGYSHRALVDKLGIKAGMRCCFLESPTDYRSLLGPLSADTVVDETLRGAKDFIHVFVTRRSKLASRLPSLKRALRPAGMLWVSWPKRSSGVASDVTEDVVRQLALAAGLVDVKVCAVDETWSGLKLVIPLRDRPRPGRR